MASGSDVELPSIQGIDPLHPLETMFRGNVYDLPASFEDGVYLYVLEDGAQRPLYVGATRRPTVRFARHQRERWWPRVAEIALYRICCRWHDGAPCTVEELDGSARSLERWMIDLFEPQERLGLIG